MTCMEGRCIHIHEPALPGARDTEMNQTELPSSWGFYSDNNTQTNQYILQCLVSRLHDRKYGQGDRVTEMLVGTLADRRFRVLCRGGTWLHLNLKGSLGRKDKAKGTTERGPVATVVLARAAVMEVMGGVPHAATGSADERKGSSLSLGREQTGEGGLMRAGSWLGPRALGCAHPVPQFLHVKQAM